MCFIKPLQKFQFLKICSKISQIQFKIVRQIKIRPKLPKDVLCLFSIYIFFRISTKFSQNFNQKLKNTLNGMVFDNSFLSFRIVFLYFSIIQFFSLYLSRACKMGSEKQPQRIWMKIVFLKGLCSWQIRAVNETITLATARLEVSLQKLFAEYERKLTCLKGVRSWHGFVSRTKTFYSPTRC